MKRHANLFDAVVAWPNLLRAAKTARHGKTRRPVVERFEFCREWELLALQRELEAGTYAPGPFRTHRITRPKPRLISAAPYRDRVAHHAIMNVLAPVLDARFHPDSYACRAGKGTHAASRRLQQLMGRYPFALRADISQYFPSIDHAILKDTFRRHLKDRRLLALLDAVVDGSNEQDAVHDYFPGDDLFTPFERRRGLPIGNLTSQWFANWYLNAFDHEITSGLGYGGYVRYCDDFVIFGTSREQLADLRQRMNELLAGLRLRAHPRKTAIVPTRAGITFVGYRTWAHRREVRGSNIRLFLKRCRLLKRLVDEGRLALESARTSVMGWCGHAAQADSLKLFARLAKRWPFTELNRER